MDNDFYSGNEPVRHGYLTDRTPHTELARELIANLRTRYNTLRKKSRISVIFLFLGGLLAGIALFLLVETFFYLPPAAKTGIWIILFTTAAIPAFFYRRKYLSDSSTFIRFYRSFCDTYGYNELENALDLYLDPSGSKSGLHLLAIQKNLETVDFDALQDKLNEYKSSHTYHKNFLSTFTFLAASLLLAGTLSWMHSDSLDRTLTFWQSFEQPNPFSFVIVPGDTTLEHGSSFEPEIEFTGTLGQLPDRVTLAIRTDIEEEYRYRPMELVDDRTYRSRPIELTGATRYYVTMDGFNSDPYQVNVQLRPRFEDLTVQIDPPPYTGLASDERSYPFARIRAYGGSQIQIYGTSNKPLDDHVLLFGDEDITMEQAGDDSLQYRAEFTVSGSDTIAFHMTDQDGLSNRNSFNFTLDLLEDEYPVVFIREPEQNLTISEPDMLDIFYQAADDFGLTRAELNWELNRAFSDNPVTGSMELDRPSIGETQHIPWELGDMDLRPRDKLTFWVTVWDNDQFSGSKSSDSQHLILEVPSMSAHLDQIEQRERNVQDSLEDVSESFRQMERDYEQFRERMRQNMDPGWEEQQMLDDVSEQQREIENAIQQLGEEFEDIRNEINSNSQISEETRRTYNELQDLIEQLDDPELQRALEELRNALENMNQQDLQRAMEDFEFNEQVYKERLERTLELFKTLKMNSDLDKLAAQYEDLSERMRNVAEEEERSNGEKMQEQQGVREDTDTIGHQLEELDNSPPNRARERLQQLKEESSQELREIQEKLDDLIEQSNGNSDPGNGNGDPGGEGESEQMDEIRQQQQELSDQFQARADAMREAQQQMSGQQIQVNLLALQQSLYTLLELSESQEDLSRLTGRTESRSQGFVELARDQQNILSQFTRVADTLYQVSSEIPSLSNDINRRKSEIERILSRSVDHMADREQRSSVITTRESLGGINDLSSMIANAIDQLMDQQSNGMGGSMSMQQMLEQMENMSGEQQMMNEQLQELINDMQGERLSREQSERLDQLARQQNEIRQQLEELQRSGALRQGDTMMSELQRLSEEMEDAINDMRGGMTDPLMIERQQNILSRMLNAEESLQERGQTDEYEGRRPEDFDRTMPPGITLDELRQEIRTRLQDPEYTRFQDDYQRLIERYFELLRRFEDRPMP